MEPLIKKYIGFKKLVEKLKRQGKSDESAKRIAASIMRKKYTKKQVSRMLSTDKTARTLGFAKKEAEEKIIPLIKKYLGFKKLVQKLAHKKGIKNPKAVAAWIGRRKYGKKAFQAKAARARKMKKSELIINYKQLKKALHCIRELKKKRGVPKDVDPRVHERCVMHLKEKGHDKVSAYAICNAVRAGKKKKKMEKSYKKFSIIKLLQKKRRKIDHIVDPLDMVERRMKRIDRVSGVERARRKIVTLGDEKEKKRKKDEDMSM